MLRPDSGVNGTTEVTEDHGGVVPPYASVISVVPMAGRSLAAAQTVPVRGDVAANVDQHVRLVHAAAQRGVRVLVFPELSLTGYELDLGVSLAFAEHDPRLQPLVELAGAHAMTLIVGAPMRIETQLHLGAFILGPDGSIDVYTKHYLGAFPSDVNPNGVVPPPEASVFAPGRSNPLLRFAGHTGAVAICADTGRPAHAQAAADRGADTFLASVFVIPADFDADMVRLRQYAAQHRMTVVFANFGGPSGGLPSAGRSAVIAAGGETLVEFGATGSGLAIATEEDNGWRVEVVPLDPR